MYGKQTECAFAAMSRLAEVYDGGQSLLSAIDIAAACGLQHQVIAKVLTALSQSGLVIGMRGPGGGFTLAREPSDITLFNVYKLFELGDDWCPLGESKCGEDNPCEFHHKMIPVRAAMNDLLHETTFDVFCRDESSPPRSHPKSSRRKTKTKRPSYRASPTSSGRRFFFPPHTQ